jgi:Fe2+ or Zn2+ uptake regulation protein
MQSTSAYVDSLRPAGSKRSSKRDFIVDVFLRQDGHISADDLVEIIRREDARISRATVYRTLQWMVEAGIARKVDFGEGRYRFEHSYRSPARSISAKAATGSSTPTGTRGTSISSARAATAPRSSSARISRP